VFIAQVCSFLHCLRLNKNTETWFSLHVPGYVSACVPPSELNTETWFSLHVISSAMYNNDGGQ